MRKITRLLKGSPFSKGHFQPKLISRRLMCASVYGKFNNVSIIGAPFGYGQRLVGVEQGPSAIRNAGLVSDLSSLGLKVKDHGDLSYPIKDKASKSEKIDAVGMSNKLLCDTICKLPENAFTSVLGGDHSMGLGSIAAQLKKNPDVYVIWVDAHGDINTLETSPSGNYHGMVVAMLLKLYEPELKSFEWLKDIPALNPKNLIYIAIRDLDPGEKIILKDLDIMCYSAEYVQKHGIEDVMKKINQYVSNNNNNNNNPSLHLSYDIDAVDPLFAPSTGTPVDGGLNLEEAHYICQYLAKNFKLKSMDLVEVNPMLRPHGAEKTANLASSLIASALGKTVTNL